MRFEFHDGYFDGAERELRGFGQVDAYDSTQSGVEPGVIGTSAIPALMRTWFHLGTPMWDRERPIDTYAGDSRLPMLGPSAVDDADNLDSDEILDGLRAMAGFPIRRETYAIDSIGNRMPDPIEVQQLTYRLRRLQPAMADRPAAFSAVPIDNITWAYELRADDPRVTHQVLIESDMFDFPIRTASVGYARRAPQPQDVPAQGQHLIRVNDEAFAHIDQLDRFELAIPTEAHSYELVGLSPGAQGIFTRDQLRARSVVDALAAPALTQLPPGPYPGPQASLLTWEQTFYWDDGQAASLALGQIGQPRLLHHEEGACFTPSFAQDVLAGRVNDAQLVAAGYFKRAGLWWQADDVHGYGPAKQFHQETSLQRADGAVTSSSYDSYALAEITTTDAAGNQLSAEIDYCRLAPWRVTDANHTVREVRYDPLGVIVTASEYGEVKDQAWGFDPLSAILPADPASVGEALTNPANFVQSAGRYVWYDLDAWSVRSTPTVMVALTREALLHDGVGGGAALGRTQVVLTYVDGLGRALQEKTLVDPGLAIQRDGAGHVIVDANGSPVLAASDPRWRASGHTVYNLKGLPIRRYEPYFTGTPDYEGDDVLLAFGVSTLQRYDSIDRLIGEEFPNGTLTRVTYRSWSTEEADANDTVLDSPYGALRSGLPVGDPQRAAYDEATPHAGTTRLTFLDPLGRDAGTLARGGATAADQQIEEHHDVEGRLFEIVDARNIVAFSARYDMQGRVFYQRSKDAGESWHLIDAYGREPLTWDGRGFVVSRDYDLSDRPLFVQVNGGDGPTPLDHRIVEWVYGESLADQADAAKRNLLGRVAITRDDDSIESVDFCDPRGCVMSTTRQMRSNVDTEADWRIALPLQAEVVTSTAIFDALGRPTSDTLADGSIRVYEYMAAGPLFRLRLTTPDGSILDTPILNGRDLNARGQTLATSLGNGVQTIDAYEPDTFRRATHGAARPGTVLQQITYTYDPVGNIVRIQDGAQEGPNALIGGITVPATLDLSYDAHYRLRQATGRVHQALLQNDFVPGAPNTFMGTRHISLNNGAAVERFTETYDYDAAGNLLYSKHSGTSQQWTTNMWISSTSNRSMPAVDLAGNPVVSPETRFDACGNLTSLDHLRLMEWNWFGGLGHAVVIQRPGSTDDAERYTYRADHLRGRKTTTRLVQGDLGIVEVTEIAYFDDVERKRITRNGALVLERWTVDVSDGEQRIARIYRWTKDDLGFETGDVTQAHSHYQLSTQIGSCTIELDADANLISYEEYFPYGGTAFIAGDDLREVSLKEYRYSAKENDTLTGLYYYGYRYYAPWAGRWLSPDPAGPDDDLNLYRFVLGDPVGNADPAGLDSTAPQGKVIEIRTQAVQPQDSSNQALIAAKRASLAPELLPLFDKGLSSSDQLTFSRPNNFYLLSKNRANLEDFGAGGRLVKPALARKELREWTRAHHKNAGIQVPVPAVARPRRHRAQPTAVSPVVFSTVERNEIEGHRVPAGDSESGTGLKPEPGGGAKDGLGGDGTAKGSADGIGSDGTGSVGTGTKDEANTGSGPAANGSISAKPSADAGAGSGSSGRGAGTGTGGGTGNGPGEAASGGTATTASGGQGSGTGDDSTGLVGGEIGGVRGGVFGGTGDTAGEDSPGSQNPAANGSLNGVNGGQGRTDVVPSGEFSTGQGEGTGTNRGGPGGHGSSGGPDVSGSPTGKKPGAVTSAGDNPQGSAKQEAQSSHPGMSHGWGKTMMVMGWLNGVFDQNDPNGTDAGIPGGQGTHRAGVVFQALYAVITIICTILIVKAIIKSVAKGAISRLIRTLRSPRALLRALKEFWREGRIAWRKFWSKRGGGPGKKFIGIIKALVWDTREWESIRRWRNKSFLFKPRIFGTLERVGKTSLYSWEHMLPQVWGRRFPKIQPLINSYLNSFLRLPSITNSSLGAISPQKILYYREIWGAVKYSFQFGTWLGHKATEEPAVSPGAPSR